MANHAILKEAAQNLHAASVHLKAALDSFAKGLNDEVVGLAGHDPAPAAPAPVAAAASVEPPAPATA